MTGTGRVDTVTSGAFGGLDVSWPARSEEPNGLTSPEELIAAAHATCFSMALSGGLAREGHAPEELKTSATVTFQPGEGITKIVLDVAGRVPQRESPELLEVRRLFRRGRNHPGATLLQCLGCIGIPSSRRR